MEYLQGVPEEQFTIETRFRRRLKLNLQPLPLHTLAIQTWRQRSPD